MYSSNLELIINRADPMLSGLLYLRGSQVVAGPGFYRRLIRNDAGVASARICEPCFTGERSFNDINPSGGTVSMALGSLDKLPSSGTFPIGVSSATSGLLVNGKRYVIATFVSGDVFTNVGAASNATGVRFTATGTTPTTWTHASTLKEITADLDVDATADQVATALNATVAITSAGWVTVASPRTGAYEVTFVAVGNQASLTAPILSDMFPASVISISTVQTGTTSLREVQIIRLLENPYCYAVLGTVFPSASSVVTTVQAQTSLLSAIKKLTLDPMPYGGTVLITLDGITFEAPFDATSAQMDALIDPKYTVARRANNAWEFTRTDLNVAMSLSADVTNLLVPIGRSGTMPLNTLGMFQAFCATEADTLRLKLEVNYTAGGGSPQKIYQETIEVHRDLIDLDSLVTISIGGGGQSGGAGQSDDITVSTAGTTDLAPDIDFIQWFQLVTVATGAGAYTRILTLNPGHASEGSFFHVELDIAASANPTIEIRNETAGGALLQTITGSADAAGYFVFVARFDGNAWQKLSGSFQI